MFNFWDEYKKDYNKAINFYAIWIIAYLVYKALSVRMGLSKEIFVGPWDIELFILCAITFIFIAPFIRTYLKMYDSK